MSNKQYITEKIEDTIEDIINYVKPITDTVKEIVLEHDYISPIVKLNENIRKNKINQFFINIETISNQDIRDFIKELNENEQVIFVEMINKVIDLDNSKLYSIYITTIF